MQVPPKLVGMDSIPCRIIQDLKNGTCALSSFLLSVNGWVQRNGSHAMLTGHPVLFTAKSAVWPTTQASGDGRRRPLVTLRKEYKSEYNETEVIISLIYRNVTFQSRGNDN